MNRNIPKHHVQHERLKLSYTSYVHNRINAIKKLLGNDIVIALITESDIITNDDCIIVDVDYVKISDVLLGENGCIRYIKSDELKRLLHVKNRFVTYIWNKEKTPDGTYNYECLNVICLLDIPQALYEKITSEVNYYPVKVVKVLGQTNTNNFDGGNTALGHLHRDILYYAEIISENNTRQTNTVDAWILPNGLIEKTAISHKLLSVKYLQSRREEGLNAQASSVPNIPLEQPVITEMIKVFEDKLGCTLNFTNCELLTENVKSFQKNTVYVLNSSLIPLVNNRRGCLVKWNKRNGPDTLYWLEGLGNIRLQLRE